MTDPSRLASILANPTLHPKGLLVGEAAGLHWHGDADSPRSSQAFCVSAFGTLRGLAHRDQILQDFLGAVFPHFRAAGKAAMPWDIRLEAVDKSLLGESGAGTPTNIDALLTSPAQLVCIESKFVSDAAEGLGGCGQFRDKRCAGFRGRHSDSWRRTAVLCRLEEKDGRRSPRLYWKVGQEFFRASVFAEQHRGDICPLRDGNYQLMRNFLTAAMWARKEGQSYFGALVMCPKCTSSKVKAQVEVFRSDILRPDFADHIQFATYEQYIAALRPHGADAQELAGFLESRIHEVALPKNGTNP